MTLAPKWIEFMAVGISDAVHSNLIYGEQSEHGLLGKATLTATALAVCESPEYEVLVYNQLCCPTVKRLWRSWYYNILKINNQHVDKINASIDIPSMLSALGVLNANEPGKGNRG